MIKRMEPIQVPQGIRYLGNWNEFSFNKFPDKFILDKQLPGCGFTEYCTKNETMEDVILCSPRIMLINNKADQHPDDVFLVRNEMDKDPSVDKDLNKQTPVGNSTAKITEDQQKLEDINRKNSEIFSKIKKDLTDYVYRRSSVGLPIKILVTYDSYHIVKDILTELDKTRFDNSYTVVDEFQSILHDSRFKSNTELQFLSNLKSTKHVIFASATPMMEEYLNMLDEFDGLPYFELDWYSLDPTRIIKPDLEVLVMRSVGEKACKVIKTYLDGKFESVVIQKDGQSTKITSTEAVLYVNSVNHITTIIKRMNLTPDQVLILCSNTDENAKKIKSKLGKDFKIGHVPNPQKGEKFPMFTFCTRTVYLGADFYSTCARSFIFSDANIDSLAVDISEDLPQILGRQRWSCNPWKNSATFYYRSTANYRYMKEEDFQAELDRKMIQTNNLLSIYNKGDNAEKYSLAKTYRDLAKLLNYKNDYVGVNTIFLKNPTGEVTKILKPTINNLVYVNEIRAFKIQQIDYKDRFTVFSSISNKLTPDDLINQEVVRFMRIYESLTTIHDKLQMLCEYDISNDAKSIVLGQISDSDEVKSYYLALPPEKLKALYYNSAKIKKELNIITFSPELLTKTIYEEFNIGDKITLSDIKIKLTSIYNKINYSGCAKATDLLEFFDVKKGLINCVINGVKKRSKGYELLTKLK